jgi:hypothetical protein
MAPARSRMITFEPAGTLVRSDALLAFYEKRLSNQQQSPTVLLKSLSNRPGCR